MEAKTSPNCERQIHATKVPHSLDGLISRVRHLTALQSVGRGLGVFAPLKQQLPKAPVRCAASRTRFRMRGPPRWRFWFSRRTTGASFASPVEVKGGHAGETARHGDAHQQMQFAGTNPARLHNTCATLLRSIFLRKAPIWRDSARGSFARSVSWMGVVNLTSDVFAVRIKSVGCKSG